VARSKHILYLKAYRVLVFKEAPRILFTGLTKAIGEPRDLDKNLESPDYFEKAINIDIP
jgi:hypothetical protein